ncbi:protein LZIC-like isoform X4 [Cylas formicarius]|uniref:protein LZIC-like isoform X4 n=1 Tax=Cylas formicarius TaxID=197179 RepID=UPI002958BD33|nr:protein LZIC-like isoform X4 [Cylas formicarius]
MSLGKVENEKLKHNLESQLNRLVEQLNDLEKSRNDLDSTEYEETKEETIEQLKELNEMLEKLVKGDISLVTTLGEVQLATQAAISKAFKTPEVMCLFGKRDTKQLREALVYIKKQVKHNKLSASTGDARIVEVLTALRQQNEQLTPQELQFLQKQTNIQVSLEVDFIKVDD